MNWLTGGEDSFERSLALHPELHKKYLAFLSAVDGAEAVPADVLSVCRTRIRQIHGLVADEPLIDASDAQLTALQVAESIPYQHHQLTDETVAAARETFGSAGCVALLTALSFYDVACRLDLTFQGEG